MSKPKSDNNVLAAFIAMQDEERSCRRINKQIMAIITDALVYADDAAFLYNALRERHAKLAMCNKGKYHGAPGNICIE
jgi:hypothetical protein